MKKRNPEWDGLIEGYSDTIRNSADPVFRTGEVLIKIDNLFLFGENEELGLEEKIHILKGLKKNLKGQLSECYRICLSQFDRNDKILTLIEGRIVLYQKGIAGRRRKPRISDRRRVS